MPYSLRSLLVAITLVSFVGFAVCGDDPLKKEPAQPDAKGIEDVWLFSRISG